MPTIRHAALSDRGLTHQANEDRCCASAEQGLWFVTDGMANDLAPQVVLDELPGLLAEVLAAPDLRDAAVTLNLQRAVRRVSDRVSSAMLRSGWGRGLGATLVLTVVRGTTALLAHVGDSRIYLWRDEKLQALTRDHSFIQDLLTSGTTATADAPSWSFNGGPTRYLGQNQQVLPDVSQHELQAGDRMLLCSDGLTTMLQDDEIAAILRKHPEPEASVLHLVAAANAAGGRDNITVIVLAVE